MDILFTIGDNETPVVEINNARYVQKPLQNARLADRLVSMGVMSHHDDNFVYYPFYEHSMTLLEYLYSNTHYNKDELSTKLISTVKSIHDNGIVHGDIHPENIIVITETTKTVVMLIDFEQSSFVEENNDSTPLYIPRNWDGKNNIDTDLYGLGACLFRIYDTESKLPIGTSLSSDPELYVDPINIRYKPDIPNEISSLIKQYLHYQYNTIS